MNEVRETGAMPILGAIQQRFFPALSIIIPYHNEGIGFLNKTISDIKETCDITYEIIVVDDFSDEPISIKGVKVIRQPDNLGVGAAFDRGIKESKSNNLFLMGCDIRFANNGWGRKMFNEIKKHPKSLICTSVVSLWAHEPKMTFEQSRRLFKYNGASIIFKHTNEETPDQPEDFKSILNAQWMPREYLSLIRPDVADGSNKADDAFAAYLKEAFNVDMSRMESYEIPCILGAAYGVSKKWYKHIDGFWGHKKWGTLEPYISLKCWLMGGSCLTAPHIETAHIFKNTGTHGTGFEYLAYNKLLVAWLLFSLPDKDRLINHLNPSEYLDKGKELIEENFQQILKKRYEYQSKFKMSISEFVKKFNLKF